jgi:hypothetical protein
MVLQILEKYNKEKGVKEHVKNKINSLNNLEY